MFGVLRLTFQLAASADWVRVALDPASIGVLAGILAILSVLHIDRDEGSPATCWVFAGFPQPGGRSAQQSASNPMYMTDPVFNASEHVACCIMLLF